MCNENLQTHTNHKIHASKSAVYRSNRSRVQITGLSMSYCYGECSSQMAMHDLNASTEPIRAIWSVLLDSSRLIFTLCSLLKASCHLESLSYIYWYNLLIEQLSQYNPLHQEINWAEWYNSNVHLVNLK